MGITEAVPNEPLARRVLVTLGGLALSRLGCLIPLPGVDAERLGWGQPLRGLTLDHVSIFALGVIPIFSALFVFEIAKLAIPGLGRWQAGGGAAAARLRSVLLVAALAIAALQAFGVAQGLAAIDGLVEDPDGTFLLGVVATLVAATALLAWLGEAMTRYGLGEGFWLLLLAPALDRLPQIAATGFDYARAGFMSAGALPVAALFFMAAIAAIVLCAKARWPAHGLARAAGDAFVDVWPALLANSVGDLLLFTLALVLGETRDAAFFAIASPARLVILAALIAGFAYLRAPCAPGGAGARPAAMTAAAQIAICCAGQLLTRWLGLPFALDGVWLIVFVGTALGVTEAIGEPRLVPADLATG